MTAPICPVNGRACPAACAGKPSCERAGAVVGRVRRAAVRKQARDAVIEAARDAVAASVYENSRLPMEIDRLTATVEALNALEEGE